MPCERSWSSDSSLPVLLGYRLWPLPEGRPAVEGPRLPLPHDIAPGQGLTATMPIRWPERAGRYRLEVDLVVESQAWFARHAGQPLLADEIEVAPASR